MIRHMTLATLVASLVVAFGMTGCDTGASKGAVTNSAPATLDTKNQAMPTLPGPPPLGGGNPIPGR